MTRNAWVDASAGVAGDMLLAALLDAGADLGAVRAAVAAVLPGEVRLTVEPVTRAGMAALHVQVAPLTAPPARRWAELRALLGQAPLDDRVREGALATFTLLAEVEGHAHATQVDDVHFHEVGAWDSVADVVGVCAALADLGVERLTSSPVGLGSGTVRTEHGRMPVPVAAVLGVLRRSHLVAADDETLRGECATPTGVALLAALGDRTAVAPAGRLVAVGSGAGTRDVPGRANLTRVVVGEPTAGGQDVGEQTADGAGRDAPERTLVELAANVDDLDPRVWPSVVDSLLAAGALDVWLTPVHMKKGRPGTVVSVLADPGDRDALVGLLLEHTTTLGVRSHEVHRCALERRWERVELGWGSVPVKLGLRDGRVLTVTPELDDCRALAERHGIPLRVVLRAAEAAAQAAGWGSGAAI